MRLNATIVLFVSFITLTPLFPATPFTGLTFGSTREALQVAAKDVSNPNSWEETAFEVLNPPFLLLDKFKPARCTLTYYNTRLYSATCDYARGQFETLLTNLTAQRGKTENIDLKKQDKSATWYGAYVEGRFTEILNIYQSDSRTVVSYSDESQKDFHFADLFRGSLVWVIIAIVGLFIGYLIFGWLVTSKCPKCKKRKMKITGKTFDNPQDYNPTILGRPDIHWDEVYHYKCANCGFEKDDRYSGFMNWWRSRED